MTVTSGIVLFVLIWWLVFFMTLPLSIRRAADENKGHDSGAPANPRLWTKAALTTAISAVVFALAWGFIAGSGFGFR